MESGRSSFTFLQKINSELVDQLFADFLMLVTAISTSLLNVPLKSTMSRETPIILLKSSHAASNSAFLKAGTPTHHHIKEKLSNLLPLMYMHVF